MKKTFFAVLLMVALGCEDGPRKDPVVPHDQIPAAAMESVSKQMRGYRFHIAYKIKVDGKDAYEIHGKNKQGDIREIDVSPSGAILEVR
jgi:hypothetical protein